MQVINISTPRLTFAARVQGDADGLPLLLLHDSFATSRWWEPLLAELPAAVRAVAPDLRGCGGSDHTGDGYEIAEQAADIAALVEALGWRSFDLVGHSAGAAIAVEFTLRHPAQVNTLALVSPVPLEGVQTPLDGFLALERMKSDEALLAAGMEALAGPAVAATPLFAALVADARRMAPAAYTEVAAALGRWNRLADGSRLTLPVRLIWGDQDLIVDRDQATRTLLTIPGADTLEVLRGVGHSSMLEAPALLAEKVLELMTEDFGGYGAIREAAQ